MAEGQMTMEKDLEQVPFSSHIYCFDLLVNPHLLCVDTSRCCRGMGSSPRYRENQISKITFDAEIWTDYTENCLGLYSNETIMIGIIPIRVFPFGMIDRTITNHSLNFFNNRRICIDDFQSRAKISSAIRGLCQMDTYRTFAINKSCEPGGSHLGQVYSGQSLSVLRKAFYRAASSFVYLRGNGNNIITAAKTRLINRHDYSIMD